MDLNARNRVILAIKHEEADRIPIDLGATSVTGIHAKTYYELRKYLGLSEKFAKIIDVEQQLAEVDKDILDLFHVDVININRVLEPMAPYPYRFKFVSVIDGSVKEVSDREFYIWRAPYGVDIELPKYVEVIEERDGFIAYIRGKLFGKIPRGGYYFWGLDRWKQFIPLADVKTVDDLKKFDWSSYKVPDDYVDVLKKRAEYLYKNTDYALYFGWAAVLHETIQSLRGWDRWLSDLRVRRSLAEAIIDNLFEILKYNVEKYVDAFGEFVQVIGFGDDFGTEEGPQISVQIFREFYKHRYEELFSIVKKRSRAYIFFHSCGSIYPLIKEFIDIGVDIINPVQISAKGMDPEKLKKEFGDQITFWGGVDTQHVLPFAKPNEVIEHVKKLIEIFAPKGGFILAPVHNIQPPTPPENIVAMFKTAYEYGKYPIKR
jgi:uroporphyrinogen decarboxylase